MSNDLYLLNGLTDIINRHNSRQDIDVKELERKTVKSATNDLNTPQDDRMMNEIREAMNKLGISLDGSGMDAAPSAQASIPTQSKVEYEPPSPYHIDIDDIPSNDDMFENRTREEQRRTHINNVLHNDEPSVQDFSFEKEREEDNKCMMLAEIDYLIISLKDMGVDVSRIPTVDESSDIINVEKVLKILRHKEDYSRYCTFAEEFILSAAHGLEYLFDGKNMWFGRWNPDLTGWNVHVNRKLKRMRTDTGKIVSHIMSDYDIGPFMRVCLELVPSMLLFSKKRSEQNSLNNLNLGDEIRKSTKSLREL